ncbi:MAG: hypothetical protein AAF728_00850 [Cyanobacteria bacterium P01_D01_bin.128]
MSDTNFPPNDSAQPPAGHQSSASSQSQASWQSVPLPHVIQPDDLQTAPDAFVSEPVAVDGVVTGDREAELLQLIQDLNVCNDHLLQRVAHLEDALETSQTALQSEIARSQDAGAPHPQIAQLISDIDYAQENLKQQRVLNETLQAQLAAGQEQIAQLERECALLRQHERDNSQALAQTETACRDLRVRLQRQQRYTLQFKVALEKSLDVAARHGDGSVYPASQPEAPPQPPHQNPVFMPKTQKIQPWSAEPEPVRPDPGLDALIQLARTQQARTQRHPSPNPSAQTAERSTPGPDTTPAPEAETLFWKDLERVIDSPAAPVPSPYAALGDDSASSPADADSDIGSSVPLSESGASSEAADQAIPETTAEPTPQFTEPSPWGAPIAQGASAQPESQTVAEQTVADHDGAGIPPTGEVAATPQSSSNPDLQRAIASAIAGQTVTRTAQSDQGLFSMSAPLEPSNSPSPLVNPLKPQKKIKSLAAVQLPNFPRRKPQSS